MAPRRPASCGHEGCEGKAVAGDGTCIAHAGVAERRSLLDGLHNGDALDFGRGVRVTEKLLAEVLAAAPVVGRRGQLREVDFRHASFECEAVFADVTFVGAARFEGARFEREASFEESSFEAKALFRDATFAAPASFLRTTFAARASFRDAVFARATFRESTFDRRVSFRRTAFEGRVSFRGATFAGETVFEDARFERQPRMEALTCTGTLLLSRAVFSEGFKLIELAGRPYVLVEGTILGAPSILSGVRPASERPRLLSLRRTDVAHLLVADVDLRCCRFVKAHNLDRLRLEGGCEFARAPRWRSRRNVLAEEGQWRADRPHRHGGEWFPEASRLPPWFTKANAELESPLEPADVASIYRDLRKGREDGKDQPGAADFHYGEMEMRRHDGDRPRAERAILSFYWLVSGYALRASRSLAALAVTIGLFAYGFQQWGFASDPHPNSVLFSLEASTSLLRGGPPAPLTERGELLWIALRLLGPAFFALTVLSIRGRVKR